MTKKNKKIFGIDFGEVCQKIRSSSGFTKEEMAKYLGITVRTYERYEAKKIRPGADVAFRLAGLYLTFVDNPACPKG